MVVASVVTHLAGSGEGDAGREAAEQAGVILPPLVGPLAALGLLGVMRFLRRRPLGPVWFLVLPSLAFGVQELTERLVNGQMAEPTILVAALVQIPFALAAYLLARLFRAALIRVVRFLASPRALPRPSISTPSWPAPSLSLVQLRSHVGAHRGRAPPIAC